MVDYEGGGNSVHNPPTPTSATAIAVGAFVMSIIALALTVAALIYVLASIPPC